ncbi:hypothetical protein KC363_g2736 [Hortaea werneckii]|uniref:BRCT domain-containing protein n=1 Tax=Hortaea werneckii TaxID=91943 RepID=A0A3M7FY28_HORWE|nr:hypothetical protein KC363_g2736 [Hortaea werneckii]RMY93788.1 hypothetical protein D0861_01732 [Hortaea werneckii]
MLVSLTVGKVDAGVAVLLTEDKRLIEFPSILLPADIHSGSIVDINVARNTAAEHLADQKFAQLQHSILDTFGSRSPSPPVLRCRNATQTSVVLEWDPIDLATAELRSLSLYRNGSKAGNIPPGKLSTKISGLGVDSEYSFSLVLRTSAGQYSSEKLVIRTHKMTDLTGITITPGIMPGQLRESLQEAVDRIGAKVSESVRIDTTHFVCTEPRGQNWEKAVEMNVPVVVPDWIIGCEREGKVIGVRAYYLDADPSKRQLGPVGATQQQHQQQQPGGGSQRGSISTQGQAMRDSPRIEHTPPTPERPTASERTQSKEQVPTSEPPAPETPTSDPSTPKATEQAPAVPPKQSSEDTSPAATPAEPNGEDANLEGSTLASSKQDKDDEKEKSDEDEKSDDEEGTTSNKPEKASGNAADDKGKDQESPDLSDNPENKNETKEKEAAGVAEEDGKFDEVDL